MSTKEVLKNPNKELRKKSVDVLFEEIKTSEFQKLVDDMIETMAVENGVGLAAPQIGIHKRLIIVEDNGKVDAYINPEITKTSLRTVSSEEGCLSVPGVFGLVKRHKHIRLQAIDRHGNKIELKAGGLTSRAFQHEIDHLDGILFIDKAYKLIDEKEKNKLQEK